MCSHCIFYALNIKTHGLEFYDSLMLKQLHKANKHSKMLKSFPFQHLSYKTPNPTKLEALDKK